MRNWSKILEPLSTDDKPIFVVFQPMSKDKYGNLATSARKAFNNHKERNNWPFNATISQREDYIEIRKTN